jgi:hypothetical protein
LSTKAGLQKANSPNKSSGKGQQQQQQHHHHRRWTMFGEASPIITFKDKLVRIRIHSEGV